MFVPTFSELRLYIFILIGWMLGSPHHFFPSRVVPLSRYFIAPVCDSLGGTYCKILQRVGQQKGEAAITEKMRKWKNPFF